MNLNGETVECPTLNDMYSKYGALFERLASLISDTETLQKVKEYLIRLEWCDLFYELINKTYGGKLTPPLQRQYYGRFYEDILKDLSELKPYLYYPEKPKLNFPPLQADSHKDLTKLLQDDQEALDLIREFYPFRQKRSNNRELNNMRIEEFFDKIKNRDKYIRAAKWQYIEAVNNKVFNFFNVCAGLALECKDENGKTYSNFTKIDIADIDGRIILIEGSDYKLSNAGHIIILPTFLQKCHDIKVTISTNSMKFKGISV